jgi:hypothetical protein
VIISSFRGSDRKRRNQDTLCCSRWSAVCGEQVEDRGAVIFGGVGAGAGGVEAGVAGQAGDDNKAWDSYSCGEPPALI